MSDIVLATRYSAENYPLGLENLAKRYSRKDSDAPINYSELGFGDLSEDRASRTLRFFGDIGLLENPKGANYIPPQSVIDWKMKMGETAEKGKEEVFEELQDYEVFSELVFVLEEGDEELSNLAQQVGGMVGIDEDELPEMERTIEVFAACGFFEISEDNTVSLIYNPTNKAETDISKQQSDDDLANSHQSDTEEPHTPSAVTTSENQGQPEQGTITRNTPKTELQISIDATEMEPDDLKKKLEIIDDITQNDGE